MRKRLSWFIALFFLAGCVGFASAACVVSTNLPQYGINTIPGSVRQVNVIQTGCPSATYTNLAVSGNVATFAGNFSSFTVGKTVVIATGLAFPFGFLQNAAMTILTANGTSMTASFSHAATIGSTALTGTVVQYSKVNWAATTGTGSVTATLSCTSNCTPNVKVIMGSTAGTLTDHGVGNPITSTQVVTITATLVDTGSNVSFPINQGANTTKVFIPGGGYHQIYKGQKYLLTSGITGNTVHAVQWAIASSPAGGDGALDGVPCNGVVNGCRDNHFHATVSGQYKLTATSIADGTKLDSIILFVGTTTAPSYASAPPDKSEMYPCEADAGMTGGMYEIGPGQTYTTINAFPWNGLGAGNIIRLHYATYAEYMQTDATGTSALPNYFCGIPDASGNQPVMDASGAHGPTYANSFLYGAGLITTFPTGGPCNQTYPTLCKPWYFQVSNIKLIHANAGYSGVKADNVTPFNWGSGSAGMDFRVGDHLGAEGMHYDDDAQGCATYDNSNNSGWGANSFAVRCGRSYFSNIGVAGDATSHPVYFQSWGGGAVIGNLIDVPHSGGVPDSCIKNRGVDVVIAYNWCAAGRAREIDHVETQDSSNFTSFEQCIPSGCISSGYTADLLAGFQEATFSQSYQFGNAFDDPTAYLNIDHFMADHDDNNGNNAMSSRLGTLWSWNETYYICGQLYDAQNSLNNENYWLTPYFYSANNIFYCTTGQHLNSVGNFAAKVRSLLIYTGSSDNTLSIYGAGHSDSTYLGWSNNTYIDPTTGLGIFPMSAPMEGRLDTNLTTDFIQTSTLPLNATSLALVSGSAAIGASSALTGEAALFTLGNNVVGLDGLMTTRANGVDLGAIGYSTTPPVTTNATQNGNSRANGNVRAQ